jgi:hypothetical protein
MAVEVEALASTQDPSESDADAQAERTKKMTAYRVSEVGPFSPPELDLFGNQTGEPEKEPEDSFTALPEVAEIIRRLAHPPTSTGKKLPADKRNGH